MLQAIVTILAVINPVVCGSIFPDTDAARIVSMFLRADLRNITHYRKKPMPPKLSLSLAFG